MKQDFLHITDFDTNEIMETLDLAIAAVHSSRIGKKVFIN